jgi:hypothetical protein
VESTRREREKIIHCEFLGLEKYPLHAGDVFSAVLRSPAIIAGRLVDLKI